MNHRFHLFGGEVKIVFTPFHPQETVAIAVAKHRTAQQIQLFRQRIALAAGKHQLPIALHSAQPAAQGFQLLIVGQLQVGGQFLTADRRVPFCQVLKNVLAAGNGKFVFFCFAFQKRIL